MENITKNKIVEKDTKSKRGKNKIMDFRFYFALSSWWFDNQGQVTFACIL